MALGLRRLLRFSESPLETFASAEYLRHNQRRQEHLASLGLDLAGRSVLELGAGVGDHTSFFLDRGCTVVTSDARPENLALLKKRHPALEVARIDLDADDPGGPAGPFEVVYSYGLLYHLSRPAEALACMAARCRGLLLLETCVTPGPGEEVNLIAEPAGQASQSVAGCGCRPTRGWVQRELKRHFAHVYLPITQPWHEQFPLDWSVAAKPGLLTRAVFVSSRQPLADPLLVDGLPERQRR